jgi:3-isopropylmalate dehydrogenase
MATRSLFLLPGDGIGPEAMAEVRKIIAFMNEKEAAGFSTDEGLVGGSAYDAHGQAISDADMDKAMAADAVLFGAVGGPKWDSVPYEVRPEAGLLRLRKDMELFANSPAASISANPRKSSIWATARSAASTPRSTTPTRSSAFRQWPSNWPAPAAMKSARWKSATS